MICCVVIRRVGFVGIPDGEGGSAMKYMADWLARALYLSVARDGRDHASHYRY